MVSEVQCIFPLKPNFSQITHDSTNNTNVIKQGE